MLYSGSIQFRDFGLGFQFGLFPYWCWSVFVMSVLSRLRILNSFPRNFPNLSIAFSLSMLHGQFLCLTRQNRLLESFPIFSQLAVALLRFRLSCFFQGSCASSCPFLVKNHGMTHGDFSHLCTIARSDLAKEYLSRLDNFLVV